MLQRWHTSAQKTSKPFPPMRCSPTLALPLALTLASADPNLRPKPCPGTTSTAGRRRVAAKTSLYAATRSIPTPLSSVEPSPLGTRPNTFAGPTHLLAVHPHTYGVPAYACVNQPNLVPAKRSCWLCPHRVSTSLSQNNRSNLLSRPQRPPLLPDDEVCDPACGAAATVIAGYRCAPPPARPPPARELPAPMRRTAAAGAHPTRGLFP